MEASDIAAIATAYASVVATAALALEIRRWFETGPRLKLTVIPRSRLVGGVTEDKNVYLTARITNTGNLPTTILNFALLEYKSYLNKIWGRACNSAIVPNPASGGRMLPYVLQPGTEWTGSTFYDVDLEQWVATGRLFVAIYHSHSSRPVLRRVTVSKEKAISS